MDGDSTLEKSVGDASTEETEDTHSNSATFIRHRGSYVLTNRQTLKNNLLPAVGYLELANAGDFAANVWNMAPIPIYAVVLMAIGGTIALCMSCFAFRDAWLGWCNFRQLCEERRRLQAEIESNFSKETEKIDIGLRCYLDVNRREMGTEFFDRIVMDALMGFGAIVVSVGTYMAIAGANEKVWLASNLLSGYIGNSPAALFGLMNALWSAFVWIRAARHGTAAAKELGLNIAKYQLEPRLRAVKVHAVISGTTGVVAGFASMVTAKMWWGYVVLIPCIISSIWLNYFWRRRLGYERVLSKFPSELRAETLVQELRFISYAQSVFRDTPSSHFSEKLGIETASLPSALKFIEANGLFDDFSRHVLRETRLFAALSDGPDCESVTITSQTLLKADPSFAPLLLEIAQACVSQNGLRHFVYRERYLLEVLGCYLRYASLEPEEQSEAQ
ncbi:hypothetical protein PRK78_004081 [Emydomyces testavorans]|uniref:Integral membrane protein n=1 Tax=Emydomyces testavorans TaxID=2070801 RepID=A0AAF0DI33_9EURO|nr:hypothetical protein PRK78_004081 [Emydomyces testavorans]